MTKQGLERPDYSTSLDWGDYDGDGDPDLIVGNSYQPDPIE